MKKWQFWLYLFPAVCICLVLVSPVLASLAGIPGEIRLFPGNEFSLSVNLPFRLLDANGVRVTDSGGYFSLNPEFVGKHHFQVRLFGFIPVRDMVVDVVPEIQVFPGGQSIGVLVNSSGLVISRVVPVRGVDGQEYYPAATAGIKQGDILLSIEGQPVTRPEHVGNIVNTLAEKSGKVKLKIQRNGQIMEISTTPVKSNQEDFTGNQRQVYLLGIFLEDPASGVGTLTFYDQSSGRYGALGHTVTDSLGRQIEISTGNIVKASIDSIKQGLKGIPGEKLGLFEINEATIGTIDKNTEFGIFGDLQQSLNHPYFTEPLAIALNHEVSPGPAKIYTVIDGNQIREFDIEIVKVIPQSQPDDKGLIIQITDPILLEKTGGIVQGMSGSPIVQKGKLVGAITHVFINDPRMGYGSFIEWMISEAGLMDGQTTGNSQVGYVS